MRKLARAVSLLCLITVGCGATPAVAATAESEAIRQIKSIALPPVILPGGVSNVDITREAFKQLTLSLALKGYVMHLADKLVLESGADPAKLRDFDPEALAALLPEGNAHYLLCWIEETAGTASPVRLRTSAALIERDSNRILWKNFAYSPESDPFTEKMSAFFGALLLEVASPYPDFYTPIMRQIEFDNRVNQLEESNKMIAALASPVAITIRAVLSTFPERPMN